MDARDLDSAVSLLSETLLGAEPGESQRVTVGDFRCQVLSTYRTFPRLQMATETKVSATAERWNIDLTSAVISSERVYELNQSFNFAHLSAKDAMDRANYWALRIEKLRGHGGHVQRVDSEIVIKGDIPVVAFVLPPTQESRQKEFKEVVKNFEYLDIAVLTSSMIHIHAANLEKSIA